MSQAMVMDTRLHICGVSGRRSRIGWVSPVPRDGPAAFRLVKQTIRASGLARVAFDLFREAKVASCRLGQLRDGNEWRGDVLACHLSYVGFGAASQCLGTW